MPKKNLTGRPTFYPWEKWLSNRKQFTLRRWVHYSCTSKSMGLQLRNRAVREGITPHIHYESDFLVIVLEHPKENESA